MADDFDNLIDDLIDKQVADLANNQLTEDDVDRAFAVTLEVLGLTLRQLLQPDAAFEASKLLETRPTELVYSEFDHLTEPQKRLVIHWCRKVSNYLEPESPYPLY